MDKTVLSTARDRFGRYGADADTLLLGGLERVEGRQFDLAYAFEVLEQVEDDIAALIPGAHTWPQAAGFC